MVVSVPFGISTKRFAKLGFHPGLDRSGSYKRDNFVGPGHYDPEHPKCWYKSRQLKDSWTRKSELEEFSEMLGYRNARILKERRDARAANGPGIRDVPEELFKRTDNNRTVDLGFGHGSGCKKGIKSFTPGPGTYGKNHEPSLRFEETLRPKHQWTYLPTFEWDGFVDRFKLNRLIKPWELSPNRYKIRDPNTIESRVRKRVSKRGPFDCFTGPRDATTIKGYFAPSTSNDISSWPMKFPSEFERLKHRKKAHYGCFLKTDRFIPNCGARNLLCDLVMCPKDPKDPGPGYYYNDPEELITENKYAFNSSVLYSRPVIRWELRPGPGRYDIKRKKCRQKKTGESWVFKSKVVREVYKIVTYNSF